MKTRRTNMSAYSQAANGFVVSDRVTLMLDMLDDDVRARVLNHAYKLSRSMKCAPLDDAKENTAANAVHVAALEIAKAFQKRQKQSREARQVGAALRETIARESHDVREIDLERREENGSPTPPIKEESKETSLTPRPPRVVFVPPTVEEVRAYCDERKNVIDPQSFIDFYSAKGWMIGSNKMKDWRAAVRNWETRRRNDGWAGRGVGVAGQADSRRAGTTTAGNFRGGTDDQRAEAEAVL